MRKGFSLAEVMIVLSVIGVVMTLTIPTMVSSFSSSNKLAYRSAYKLAEQVVSDMVMDTVTFPGGVLINDSPAKLFCNRFVDRLNTVGSAANCTFSNLPVSPTNIGNASFITSNGMRWYGFESLFSGSPSSMTIYVDVDGKGRGKNIVDNDIFRIQITNMAKVIAPTGTESSYLIE